MECLHDFFFKFKNIWTGKHIMEIKKRKIIVNTQNNVSFFATIIAIFINFYIIGSRSCWWYSELSGLCRAGFNG